jgi:heparinase II/III-like protein
VAMRTTGATSVIGSRITPLFDFVALRHTKYNTITHERRVFYSHDLDVLIVDDHLVATVNRTFRQLWHLLPDASPQWYGTNGGFITRRADANVKVRQLVGGKGRRVITGARSPIQGWVTWGYGQLQAAPVVSVSDSGKDVRFVTLFLPSKAIGRGASVKSFSLRSVGFDLRLSVNGVIERILVSEKTASEARVG